MKHKSWIIITLPLVLLLGCEDLLEETPLSSVSPETFYQSEQDVRAAVVAMYNSLIGNDGVNRNINIMTDANADDLIIRNGSDRIAIDRYSFTADNGVLVGMYASFYQGIARANDLLANIDGSPVSDAIKQQASGEAYFLRGFYYFYLVRWFGPIPLPTEPITNPDNIIADRSSEAEVYQQIISDLAAAAENLPAAYDESDLGRASQGAAHTLLAAVHMTLEDWPAARTQLENVINSNEYELFNTYAEIFYPENKNRTEHIFMLQHLLNASDGNLTGGYMTSFFPESSSLAFATFFPTTKSTGIYTAYEEGDIRKDLYLTTDGTFTYKGQVVGNDGILVDNAGDSVEIDRVYVAKYYDPEALRSNSNTNFPVLRYADVLLMYAEVLNELEGGPSGPAYNAINSIRARAQLSPLENLSQSEFRQAVYRERRVELAFEGHRWFDLKRTERLIEVMRPHLVEEYGASNIEDYHVLYPIPLQEIQLSQGTITQNDGY